jgi:hypothetical protein
MSRQPLRGRGIVHSLTAASIGSIRGKCKFTPYSGKAGRWWFFPGRGRAGGIGGGPRRPSPLNRGKTKGRAWGHGWGSSNLSFRCLEVFYVLSPILGHRYYLCPPSRLGSGRYHAGGRQPAGRAPSLPVFARPCLPALQRPNKMRSLRVQQTSKRTGQNSFTVHVVLSAPACAGVIRQGGLYGLLSGFSAVRL